MSKGVSRIEFIAVSSMTRLELKCAPGLTYTLCSCSAKLEDYLHSYSMSIKG